LAHRQICAILLGMQFMSLACAAPDASPWCASVLVTDDAV
jgi:hypothetical protein